jgi:glycosyltransferase involved in cell wall biosynthesis
MDVLHICNAYQTNPLYQLLFTQLSRLGVSQVVIAPGADDGDMMVEGVKIHRFKRDTSLIGRLLWTRKIRIISRFTESFVDFKGLGIIHAHTLFSDGTIAYKLNKKYGVKYAVAVRNTDLNDYFRLPVFRPLGYKVLKHASRVYLISEANKLQFLDTLPPNLRTEISHKVKVVPNGINEYWLTHIQPKPRKPKETVSLIYAGDICHNKNLHNILAAILSDDKNVISSFEAVGLKKDDNSSYVINLKRMATQCDKFSLSPKCTKEELIEKFKEADIYIQPSFTETFGLSYIEALTQGLPVIYSKGQGIDGMFEDGQVGYPVDPNSPDDILAKVNLIKNKYENIVDNISQLDFRRFKWDAIAVDYLNDYKLI